MRAMSGSGSKNKSNCTFCLQFCFGFSFRLLHTQPHTHTSTHTHTQHTHTRHCISQFFPFFSLLINCETLVDSTLETEKRKKIVFNENEKWNGTELTLNIMLVDEATCRFDNKGHTDDAKTRYMGINVRPPTNVAENWRQNGSFWNCHQTFIIVTVETNYFQRNAVRHSSIADWCHRYHKQ